MRQQPENKKKTKRTGGANGGQIILIAVFTLIVISMTLLVIYAVRRGIGAPAVSVGMVSEGESQLDVSTAPATTEPLTEATEESTQQEDPALEAARLYLNEMTLEEKVWQLFIVSADELTGRFGLETVGEEEGAMLREKPVGGVILYEANIYTAEQVTSLLSGLQGYSGIPLLTGIAAEGSDDQGLYRFGIAQAYEDMAVYGENGDATAVHTMGAELGASLSAVGFNLNLAPVADVLIEEYNQEVGDRSFGAEAETVAQMVTELIAGLHEGGVLSCVKHFPGLASTTGNTEYGTAISERTVQELWGAELLPFQAGIGAGTDLVMVSHITLPNITGDNAPASLSAAIVNNLLRSELGFEGPVITDSLSKSAITSFYSSGEAAVLALQAGCDILLEPQDLTEAVEGILNAVEDGTLTEERINTSVLRILLLKYENHIME